MTTWTLFTLAVGLSMDAFAVAVCKGLALGKITPKNSLIIGLWFGGFQALNISHLWITGLPGYCCV